MDKNSQKQTLVEEGTQFKGSLVSKCPVVVMGAVDGDLEAPSVTISHGGEVVGSIKAESVHSEGTLAGNIDADDVYLAGTVRSSSVIRAKTLEVKLAPSEKKLEVSFAECVIEAGEEPSAETSTETEAKTDGTEAKDDAQSGTNGDAASASGEATEAASPGSNGKDRGPQPGGKGKNKNKHRANGKQPRA